MADVIDMPAKEKTLFIRTEAGLDLTLTFPGHFIYEQCLDPESGSIQLFHLFFGIQFLSKSSQQLRKANQQSEMQSRSQGDQVSMIKSIVEKIMVKEFSKYINGIEYNKLTI